MALDLTEIILFATRIPINIGDVLCVFAVTAGTTAIASQALVPVGTFGMLIVMGANSAYPNECACEDDDKPADAQA